MKKYFYTIGEVSNMLGEKPYVIRYWESEFKFLRPRKDEGRIRKYSEENIELLRHIQDMLHNQRFTIEGARQKLKAERSTLKKGNNILAEPAEFTSEQLIGILREVRSQLQDLRQRCQRLQGKAG
ncbi:MAG TPA: MerR family transcriptional regulator [Candidatus Syntrophosphaera sp.]|mgnify:CR=1 FL=1|nr:MerR family transcriptional regulator [Candidatus Syntrophosphaera sp.]